ncbi:hypothetical protein [Kiloniella sp. b19]|uniref:hypothetical protein n=1 Tax=Kiloniella sp. GXU_MW_B19 TaxID=3141326 RepID=UPI0031E1115F
MTTLFPTPFVFPLSGAGLRQFTLRSLLLSGLTATALLHGWDAAADEPGQTITCPQVADYAERYGPTHNPFYGLDYAATVNRLPEDHARKARPLLEELVALKDLPVLDAQQTKRKFDLEDLIHTHFYESRTEPVIAYLFDDLPDATQREAIGLWCEIVEEIARYEERMGQKNKRLDQLLQRQTLSPVYEPEEKRP